MNFKIFNIKDIHFPKVPFITSISFYFKNNIISYEIKQSRKN